MSTATVTRRLRAEGLPLELVRANGYHYFIFDDGTRFETRSIMVPRFREIPLETWLSDGREFAADVEAGKANR
jgi:hypothetical protein